MTPFGRDSFFTNQISGGSRQWSNFLAGGFCSTGSCSACVGGVGVDVDVRVDRCRFSKSHCRCMLIMTLMWIKYVPRPRSYLVRDIGYIFCMCVCDRCLRSGVGRALPRRHYQEQVQRTLMLLEFLCLFDIQYIFIKRTVTLVPTQALSGPHPNLSLIHSPSLIHSRTHLLTHPPFLPPTHSFTHHL